MKRRIKDLRQKKAKCHVFSLKRHQKIVKQMEYDVKNGDQTTLEGFK